MPSLAAKRITMNATARPLTTLVDNDAMAGDVMKALARLLLELAAKKAKRLAKGAG